MRSNLSGLFKQASLYQMAMTLLVSAILGGCQAPHQALQQLADERGRTLQILQLQPYPLVLLSPRMATVGMRLRVYIEGDGHAWSTSSQPSLDPSPYNLLVARLAADDPTPNAYLARPCQFVSAPNCKPQLWTNRRFSQEVVDSLSQALDQLKRTSGNRDFELVGYSGSAALALLLAAQRDDVILVQTIAGNLSPRLWTQAQGLTPLNGSLEPLDYRNRLASLPQRHLVGEQDRIVPARLAELYRQGLIEPSCPQIIRIPKASHDEEWETAWKQWSSRPTMSAGCPF